MRVAIRIAAALFAAHALNGLAMTNAIDSRFGTAGAVTFGPISSGVEFSRIYALAMQPDGKILIAGRGNDPASPGAAVPAIGRLNSDGSWDTSFADNGMFVVPAGSAAAPQGGMLDNV